MPAPACFAALPSWACAHLDLALYLVPSLALAFLLRMLTQAHPFFFLFTLAGTLCHELAHLVAGRATNARPSSFSVIPRRAGNTWQLGAVTLSNVRWYNAAPTALAPLVLVAIPLAVAWLRTRGDWAYEPVDLALAFLLAPQFLSFWPSPDDWKIALRSWPYLIVIGLAGWACFNL